MNARILIAGGLLMGLTAAVGFVVIHNLNSTPVDDVPLVDANTPAEKLAEALSKRKPPESESPTAKTRRPLDELVQECLPSVAIVKGKVGHGTGFMLPQNVLATNAHVVAMEFEDNIRVTFPSAPKGKQGPYRAKFIFADKKRDVAFLEVNCDVKPLELAEEYKLKAGEEVFAIGSPGLGGNDLLPNSPTKGLMSNVKTIMGEKFFALSMSVNPGNSGGPVIDMNGRVLGMITLKARDKDGIAFAVPVEDINVAYVNEVLGHNREASEEMISWLRACTVFERLIYLGDEYLYGLETYSHAMDAAHARGGTPNDGLKMVSKEMEGRIKKINAILADSLEANVRLVVEDQNMAPQARSIIGRLWATCQEMKSFFDRPRGTIDSYRRKKEELKRRYRDLVAIAVKPKKPGKTR